MAARRSPAPAWIGAAIALLALAIANGALLAFILLRGDGGPGTYGSAAIDRALAPVVAGDAGAIAQSLAFTTLPCTPEETFYFDPDFAPRCPAGAEQGDAIDVLLHGRCEGGFATREEAPALVGEYFPGEQKVFAVFASEEIFGKVPTQYRAVVAPADADLAQTFPTLIGIRDGGIAWFLTNCDPVAATVESLIAAGYRALYVAPELEARVEYSSTLVRIASL
jgi:hypothetical protein